MSDLKDHLKILGCKARDVVTGVEGVVSSVSFDLYGCVQAVLTRGTDKDGKLLDQYWFDAKRLHVIDARPVMSLPDFVIVPGGSHLPNKSQ